MGVGGGKVSFLNKVVGLYVVGVFDCVVGIDDEEVEYIFCDGLCVLVCDV